MTQSSGLPGADAAAIKIRGISTLGTSDPLVLVDGIPMDMNQLDPNTIESVTVLKDAAETEFTLFSSEIPVTTISSNSSESEFKETVKLLIARETTYS